MAATRPSLTRAVNRDLRRLPAELRQSVEALLARQIAADIDAADGPVRASTAATLERLLRELRRRADQLVAAEAPAPFPAEPSAATPDEEDQHVVTQLAARIAARRGPSAG